MNEGLVTSERGRKLVESFESCLKSIGGGKFTTYYCPANVLTCGFGHTNANGRKIKPGDAWTQGECDAALREDLRVGERAVKRRVRVELTQSQFDALVSFTFNCGEGALAKSGLLRAVNAKDFDKAAEQFAPWCHGGGKVLRGLVRRRAAEAELFRNGNHEAVQEAHQQSRVADGDTEPCPQGVDVAEGSVKPMSQSKIGNTQIAVGAAGAAEAASKVKDAVDQANSVKEGVKDLGVFDILGGLVGNPMFWLALVIVAGAALAWYWRRQHAQAGV